MTDQPERWCCAGNAEDCRLCDTADLPYPWICPGHPDTPENRKQAQEPTAEHRLADLLSREYDYRGLDELEQEDPERAQEHRDAAAKLAKWIEECPREERRAAFGRGFDRGKERQKVSTAATVTGCHWSDDGGCCAPWGFATSYHWMLTDVVALDQPVKVDGALGFWTVPDDVLAAVQRQISLEAA